MLSFFSKKKQSPNTPPEEVIQGANSTQTNSGDDFIFVERKSPDGPTQPQSSSQISTIYPPMPPAIPNAGIFPQPPAIYPPTSHRSFDFQSNGPVSYVQGVPFELSPQLTMKNRYEAIQMEVDGILALMTEEMSLEQEYDFNLERSILRECF